MRQVQMIMGLPISVDIPEAVDAQQFETLFALLRRIDRRFSPYKKHSELRRFQAGEVAEADLSIEMRKVMDTCRELQQQTEGYFSAWFGGPFDPTGYVKGWAVQQAGKLLEAEGFGTYMINAGGDILARSTGRHVWRIGLQHPSRKRVIIGTVATANIAVATSGIYARGAHIVDPIAGCPATELLSVTVIGSDIATTDALATAVFAMGKRGAAFIEEQPGYEALLIGPDLAAHMTSGFAKTQTARQ